MFYSIYILRNMNLEAQQAKIIWPNHEPVCGTDSHYREKQPDTYT